jgi:hypothetical protein
MAEGHSQDFLIRLLITAQNNAAGEIAKLQKQIDKVQGQRSKAQEQATRQEIADATKVADEKIKEGARVAKETERQAVARQRREAVDARIVADRDIAQSKRKDQALADASKRRAVQRKADQEERERLRKANLTEELAAFDLLRKEEAALSKARTDKLEREARTAQRLAEKSALDAQRLETELASLKQRNTATQALRDDAERRRSAREAEKADKQQAEDRARQAQKEIVDNKKKNENIASDNAKSAEKEASALLKAAERSQAALEKLNARKNDLIQGSSKQLFPGRPNLTADQATKDRVDADITLAKKEIQDAKAELSQLEKAAKRAGETGALKDFARLREEFSAKTIGASQLLASIQEIRKTLEKRSNESSGLGLTKLAVDLKSVANTARTTEKQLGKMFDTAEDRGKKFLRVLDSGANGAEDFARTLEKVSEQASSGGVNLSRLSGSLRGLGILAAVGASQELITSLVALGGELVSVASAASLAGAAIGGALAAGLAQAIPVVGVLGLAFERVKLAMQASSALDAAQKASFIQGETQKNKAAKSNSALANSNDTLTNALQGVAKAHEAVSKAQLGVIDARVQAIKNLQDLSFAEKQAQLTARGDQLSLEDAQSALINAVNQGATTSEIAHLQLQVDSARLTKTQDAKTGLPRAQEALRTAQAQGIEGAPNVVAAKAALKDSRESLAQANRAVDRARRGVDSAGASAAQAATNINHAAAGADYLLSRLDATEKKTVKLFSKFNDLITGPKSPLHVITDPILRSFNAGLEKIIGVVGNPKVIKPFVSLATEIGHQMRRIENAVFSPRGLGFLKTFTDAAKTNLKPFTTLLISLGNLFGEVAKAALPIFNDLLKRFSGFIKGLDDKTLKDKGKGLESFFKRAGVALNSFIALAISIFNLFGALIGKSAGEGIRTIDSLTKTIDGFTKKINDNGNKVSQFFKNAGDATRDIFHLLGAVAVALFKAFDEKTLRSFTKFIETFVLPTLIFLVKTTGLLLNAFTSIANNPIGLFLVGLVGTTGSVILVFGKLLGPLTGAAEKIGLFLINVKKFSGASEIILKVIGRVLLGIASLRKLSLGSLGAGAFILILIEVLGHLDKIKKAIDWIAHQFDSLPKSIKIGALIAGLAVSAAALASWGRLAGLVRGIVETLRGATGLGIGGGLAKGAAAEAAVVSAYGLPGQKVGYNPATGQPSRPGTGPLVIPTGAAATATEAVVGASLASRLKGGLKGGLGRASGIALQTYLASTVADLVIPKKDTILSNTAKGAIYGAGAGKFVPLVGPVIGGAIGGAAAGLTSIDDKIFGRGSEDPINKRLKDLKKVLDGIKDGSIPATTKDLFALSRSAEALGKSGGEGADGARKAKVEIDKLANKSKLADTADQAKNFLDKIQGFGPALAGLSSKQLENLSTQASHLTENAGHLSPALQKAAGYLDELGKKNKIFDALGKNARDAASSFIGLENTTGSVLDAIAQQSSDNIHKIAVDLGLGSAEGRKALTGNFIGISRTIAAAMENGRVSTDKGLAAIDANAKQIAKSLGSNSKAGKDALDENFGKAVEAIQTRMHDGKLKTAEGNKEIKKILSDALKIYGVPSSDLASYFSSAPIGPSIQGHANKKAGGGWIGNPGERGRDEVPIVVGRGEAVLNAGHQPVVNAGLRAIGMRGGLNELFGRIRGKHYEYGAGDGMGYAGGGFVQAPGTDYTKGVEPILVKRLTKLAKALGINLTGISGYRSPQHSVEVGGFANDPHTRGQASDTPGVEGVSEAVLEKYGLTRPFGGAAELDHIQLFGPGSPTGAPGSSGGISGVLAAIKKIILPKVGISSKSALGGVLSASLNDVRNIAQKRLDQAYDSLGLSSGGAGGGGGNLAGFSGGGSNAANRKLARKMMVAFGYPDSEWGSLNQLWDHESGFSTTAGSTGAAYGIPQADPGSKMASEGPGWLHDAATQIRWGLKYIKGRYGTPGKAWAGWYGGNFAGTPYAGQKGYARGGFAGGGLTTMYDATGDTLGKIPTKHPGAVASYVDNLGGYSKIKSVFPKTKAISITVTPGHFPVADIVDIEGGKGNGGEGHNVDEPGMIPWFKKMIGMGRKPGAYGGTQQSPRYNLNHLRDRLTKAHIDRSKYNLWLSSWNNRADVPSGFDAHQYKSGQNFDVSVAKPSFFSGSSGGSSGPKGPQIGESFPAGTLGPFAQSIRDILGPGIAKAKAYAVGGELPGPLGHAQNIIGHGKEWVLNEAQKRFVAGPFGGVEALRSALGFAGGGFVAPNEPREVPIVTGQYSQSRPPGASQALSLLFKGLGKTGEKGFEDQVRFLGAHISDIFTRLGIAFDKIKERVDKEIAAKTYKIDKTTGKVVKEDTDVQLADLTLRGLQSEGKNLDAQVPSYQSAEKRLDGRIASIKRKLRQPGLSPAAKQKLNAELQQLVGEKRKVKQALDVVQGARTQNVADRFGAQEALAAAKQAAEDARQAEFDKREGVVNDLASRQQAGVARGGRLAALTGAFDPTAGARLQAGLLGNTGDSLAQQRNGLYGILKDVTGQNPEDIARRVKLQESIAELDVSIAENTAAQRDATTTIRQTQIDAITNRGSFQGGVQSGIAGIYDTLDQISGAPNADRKKANLAQQRTVLMETLNGADGQPGLIEQLSKATGGSLNLAGLDSQGIAGRLGSTNFDSLESGKTQLERTQIENLVNAILGNTQSLVSNTQATQQATSTLAQSFTSSAFEIFRTAIFNGNGGLLPQYEIPHMSVGGDIIRGGLVRLHDGETVKPAQVSLGFKGDQPVEEHNTYNFQTPMEIADPGLIASEISWRKSLDRAS